MSSITIDNIRKHQERINALRQKRDSLTGELAQMERQLEETMVALRDEHGVESIEAAQEKISELERQVKEDEARMEKLLSEAEASLS